MGTIYFLLGENCVRIYNESGIEAVKKDEEFYTDSLSYDEQTTIPDFALEVMNITSGYFGTILITKEEFDYLNN